MPAWRVSTEAEETGRKALLFWELDAKMVGVRTYPTFVVFDENEIKRVMPKNNDQEGAVPKIPHDNEDSLSSIIDKTHAPSSFELTFFFFNSYSLGRIERVVSAQHGISRDKLAFCVNGQFVCIQAP